MIGSHNTMTYLPPRRKWLWWLKWIAQCQSKDYREQWEHGARAFDLRIFFNNDGVEYRHGLISYDADNLIEFLDFCNRNGAIVRVLFEERNWVHLKLRSKIHDYKNDFKAFCKDIDSNYPNITFYGGWNTSTHEQIYKFGNSVIDRQCYTSFTPFAWIYALFHRKHDSDVVMCYDFIEI